jgi:hypothetical protein
MNFDLEKSIADLEDTIVRSPILLKKRIDPSYKILFKTSILLSTDDEILSFIYSLDELSETLDKGTILNPLTESLRKKLAQRFPVISTELYEKDMLDILNLLQEEVREKIFFNKHEEIQDLLIKQSFIKEKIIEETFDNSGQIVVLILIDGLSYFDFKKISGTLGNDFIFDYKPVIVDTITNTVYGFTNIIYGKDNIPLSVHLHDNGFKSLGFSYWERTDNELTDKLFLGISNYFKINSFQKIIDTIFDEVSRWKKEERIYIQILREGLDKFAHEKRERLDINGEIKNIFSDVKSLSEIFKKTNCKFKIYLTSDHGILWKKDRLKVMGLPSDLKNKITKNRFYQQESLLDVLPSDISDDCIKIKIESNNFYMLKYPYLFKNLRSNEQGVHGGFSMEESLVPLIELEGE